MPFLVDLLALEGVPRADAEACIYPYIEGKLRDLEDFHRIGPDMARLLGLPPGCIHTPADYYITVGRAGRGGGGPGGDGGGRGAGSAHVTGGRFFRPPGGGVRVMSGDEGRPAGRILYKFGGGYILPPEAYPLLGAAGVNTVLQIGCGRAARPRRPGGGGEHRAHRSRRLRQRGAEPAPGRRDAGARPLRGDRLRGLRAPLSPTPFPD